MVSREEMLGERERRDVGVDGTDDDEYEEFEGYDSLYLVATKDGEELLVRRVEVGVVLRNGEGVT